MEQLRLPAELVAPLTNAGRPGVNAAAEIHRMWAAGYGDAVVARSLNARSVPTPSGRGRWWPETVRRHADPVARARWNAYIHRYRHRV